ncbi:hypothetical protein C8J56DRAFT_710321, partial [Mycena floridula]
YPLLISVVNSLKSGENLDFKPNRHLTSIGTVFPEDRQIRMSTILQFRAMDFGMEICELQISVPNTTANNFKLPTSELVLYRLNQLKALHEGHISFSNRPSRASRLSTITFNYGMLWKQSFTCRMDELITLELACPLGHGYTGDCDLEWSQNQDNPSPG